MRVTKEPQYSCPFVVKVFRGLSRSFAVFRGLSRLTAGPRRQNFEQEITESSKKRQRLVRNRSNFLATNGRECTRIRYLRENTVRHRTEIKWEKQKNREVRVNFKKKEVKVFRG